MTNPEYPFETQADICDFFLNAEENKYITKTYHEQAQKKMEELFRENMVSELSIFANRQNVHSESIELSSDEVLKKLHEKYALVPSRETPGMASGNGELGDLSTTKRNHTTQGDALYEPHLF